MVAKTIDFLAREIRYDLDVPVLLYLLDGVAAGHTINISGSGVLAVFNNRRVDAWDTGRLRIETRGGYLSIEVRVARVEGHQAGMTFRIENESDRVTIRELIALAMLGLAILPPAPAA